MPPWTSGGDRIPHASSEVAPQKCLGLQRSKADLGALEVLLAGRTAHAHGSQDPTFTANDHRPQARHQRQSN